MIAPLSISKAFPEYHPKAKQDNGFRDKILDRNKLHTCRANYNFWATRLKPGMDLSLRQWTGIPRRSPQEEFMLIKSGEWCLQRVVLKWLKNHGKLVPAVFVEGKRIDIGLFARNDGFDTVEDFVNWFPKDFSGAIIHFTKNVYQ